LSPGLASIKSVISATIYGCEIVCPLPLDFAHRRHHAVAEHRAAGFGAGLARHGSNFRDHLAAFGLESTLRGTRVHQNHEPNTGK
jgi:hypothetical protein